MKNRLDIEHNTLRVMCEKKKDLFSSKIFNDVGYINKKPHKLTFFYLFFFHFWCQNIVENDHL